VAGTPSVYIGRNRVLTLTPWGVKMITSADDLSLMPDVALTGEYDAPFLRFLERTIRPGDAVVDVGANVGLFTLRMAWLTGPSGWVLALEPNPRVRALLEDNVAMNYATPWVTVSPTAAAASAEVRTLHLAERFQGNSSLVLQNDKYRRHFRVDTFEQVEVTTAPLDDVVPLDRQLRLVKIDVEGAEAEVLEGMQSLIDQRRCDLIDIEVGGMHGGPGFEALLERLDGLADRGATFAEVAPTGAPAAITLAEVRARRQLPHLIIAMP
jgi:FkbM family methyltransferase